MPQKIYMENIWTNLFLNTNQEVFFPKAYQTVEHFHFENVVKNQDTVKRSH